MNTASYWRILAYVALAWACAACVLAAPVWAEEKPTGARQALLIGCSDYQHLPGENLRGPKNDAQQLAQVLISRFSFAPANVRSLVGWPDDAALRPTRLNILRELDDLIAKATVGDQIVLAFSGHGTRLPIPAAQHPLDPKNPEPDGFDEAFVAADARLVNGQMQNLILDDELGQRLQKLRATGAHVWAIFDCCHSGTMSRGAADDDSGEVSRELTPAMLGVPAAAIQEAEEKATALARPNSNGAEGLNIFDVVASQEEKGSCVAFYAAQPFETAPDLPCPPTAAKIDKNYYGLLTYSTLQVLLRERPAQGLTYRELGQAVVGRYRAERGTRGPTPNFSGDLDREVLGLRNWPGRSTVLLQKSGTGWGVNAGELQGLSTGSILAIYPVASAAEATPLGYVRVQSAAPTTAEVEPCDYEKTPAIASAKLQPGLRCEIVSRQLGDLRLKLFVSPSEAEVDELAKTTRDLLNQAAKSSAEVLVLSDNPSADWHLQAVTPAVALRDYQLKLSEPRVLLVRRGEFGATPAESKLPPSSAAGRVWQQYDPRDKAALQANLTADLQKIFTWQNLWRIAGHAGSELTAENRNLKVELAALTGAEDKSGGKLLSQAQVRSGEFLELRIANEGNERLWVTLLLLDSNFRVLVLPAQQLNRAGGFDSALQPIVFQVAAKTSGPQSWLVIASSAENSGLEPDFRFLEQTGLGKSPRIPLAANRAGNSPFETLALAVAGQPGLWRGGVAPSARNPQLILRSWTAKVP